MSAETNAVIISIPQPSILAYLTGERILDNVPEGALLTAAWFERRGNFDGTEESWLMVRIEHPSLSATPAGGRLPFEKARYRRTK